MGVYVYACTGGVDDGSAGAVTVVVGVVVAGM